jgi:hypothetical protein
MNTITRSLHHYDWNNYILQAIVLVSSVSDATIWSDVIDDASLALASVVNYDRLENLLD